MKRLMLWLGVPPLALLCASGLASAQEKSIGGKLSYNFAHGACESWNSECDDESLGGGIYFRHNLSDPYFYQIGFEYLGRYDATYPALSDPSQDADYKSDIYGLGLSVGRIFALSEKHAIIGQLGAMPWYVETKGHEPSDTVKEDDFGVSPFASIAYQYQMNSSSALELGYQYVYGVGTDDTGGTDISQVFINMAYQFGQSEVTSSEAVTPMDANPSEFNEPVAQVTTVTEESMTIDFAENNSTVIFAFDSDKLNPQMYPLLQPMEQRLLDNPQATLEIESHTDNRGSDQYNMVLSQRRGDNLKAYFVEKGIDAKRISVKPYGESKPLVDNNTPENRATNRRVVLFSPSFTHQVSDGSVRSNTTEQHSTQEGAL